MFCDKCGKNYATTHIKTVVNGVVTEQNLCNECAAKSGYTSFGGGSISQFFSTMLGANSLNIKGIKCPTCGAYLSEISKTGKVGCCECYNIFKNELLPFIKRIHGSVKHIGEVPNSSSYTENTEKDKVQELKSQLTRLVEEENYEQAAVVRDKIKELEGE